MDFIQTANKQVDKFGAGQHGFSAGNPAGGVLATNLSNLWCDDVQQELINVIQGMGIAPAAATPTQVKQAIDMMIRRQLGATCVAAGTADALTGAFAPAVTALNDRMRLRVRAAAANATATPTFAADATAAKTIVKGANRALVPGDIDGAGHWLELEYDGTLDKYVLMNPATGVFGGLIASAILNIAATGALAATDMGKTATINSAAATTTTLPAANAVPPGRRIEFININAGTGTVQRAGADTITVNNATVTSLALGAGDTLTLESNGANGWYAVAGSAQLGKSAAFGASLASAGYQKLPSGLIIQWGSWTSSATSGNPVAVTFPIAFPNNRFAIASMEYGASASTQSAWGDTPTLTGFNGRAVGIGVACEYMALGY